MKLNYSFTKREIAMILALVLVLVGLLYYRFVYIRIGDQVEQYDTTDLEAQVQVDQLRLIELQKMQDEIKDKNGVTSTSSLETYDNQKQEISLLNDIFEPVIRYNFSFEKPVATGDTVRRNVSVSFTTIDYGSALDIIHQLYASPFRVQLKDISISPGDLTTDYLTALATQAMTDGVALNLLKKQVNTLLNSDREVSNYVMRVYTGEAMTEPPETEPKTEEQTEPLDMALGENPEGVPAEEIGETIPPENAGESIAADGLFEDDSAEGVPADGIQQEEAAIVETNEEGLAVGADLSAPVATVQTETETESETETETEKPVQTLENSLVNVSLSMTFYETAYGAKSLDGLIIETPATDAPASE